MAGDIHYQNTSLLLSCDGVNNTTSFYDTSYTPKIITANGNAKISTAQKKFGLSSGLFDGSGDYLSSPSNVAWQFGTSDFTVEAFINFSVATNGTSYWIAGLGTAEFNSNAGWGFLRHASNVLRFIYTPDGAGSYQVCDLAFTPTTGVWHHIAATKSGASLRVFINGVSSSPVTVTNNSVFASTSILSIAADNAGTIGFNGYMDDLRITKGVARYTGNFTPPTVAGPNYSGQINYTIIESLAASSFRLIANKISDGTLAKTSVIAVSGVLDMPLLDTVSLAAIPVQGNKWQSGTIFAAGDLVFPTSNPTYYFKRVAGTGGTSGSTEPTWVNTVGDTTTDDGAWSNCWECIALLADSISHSPIIPSDTSPPTVVFDFTCTKTYLHEAWSPDNNAFVYWTDTTINLSPTTTQPSSVVANLTNKSVVRKNK